MSEPKLSLFPTEGPPRAAPLVAETLPPLDPPTKHVDAGKLNGEDAERRLLAIAIADAAEVVRDLTLILNAPRAEHSKMKVGHSLVSLRRVKHRLQWLLDGVMPELDEEARAEQTAAERDRMRDGLKRILAEGTITVPTGDPELGPLTQLSPAAVIAQEALGKPPAKRA